MALLTATPDDYTAYTGGAAPAGIESKLTRAARFLDSNVFRVCWFKVDANGLPSDALVRQAFTDAICAQAQWWVDLGTTSAAAGAGWGEVRIGSVHLSRSVTAVAPEDSPARQIAPEVWDVLGTEDLTPDRLTIGMVIS